MLDPSTYLSAPIKKKKLRDKVYFQYVNSQLAILSCYFLQIDTVICTTKFHLIFHTNAFLSLAVSHIDSCQPTP